MRKSNSLVLKGFSKISPGLDKVKVKSVVRIPTNLATGLSAMPWRQAGAHSSTVDRYWKIV